MDHATLVQVNLFAVPFLQVLPAFGFQMIGNGCDGSFPILGNDDDDEMTVVTFGIIACYFVEWQSYAPWFLGVMITRAS